MPTRFKRISHRDLFILYKSDVVVREKTLAESQWVVDRDEGCPARNLSEAAVLYVNYSYGRKSVHLYLPLHFCHAIAQIRERQSRRRCKASNAIYAILHRF